MYQVLVYRCRCVSVSREDEVWCGDVVIDVGSSPDAVAR